MADILICVLLAYLLGSMSGSLLLGRLRGVDIRHMGSGNAGGTNALRTQGWLFALGVVAIDIGKGALAAWGVPRLPPLFGDIPLAPLSLAALCGLAAVVGHVYPLFFRFRGGKGAGTAAGVILVLSPSSALPLVLVWLTVIVITGYVGLATILAGVALLPALWWLGPRPLPLALALFALALTGLLLYTHRGNLRRLLRGEENRFQRARLFRRR